MRLSNASATLAYHSEESAASSVNNLNLSHPDISFDSGRCTPAESCFGDAGSTRFGPLASA